MLDPNRYIESPGVVPYTMIEDNGLTSMFMAGGISGTDDWQKYAANKIIQAKKEIFLINPRRPEGFCKTGPEAAEQIKWEYDQLDKADTTLFWFPHQTLCPIALFELGSMLKKIQLENYLMNLTCDSGSYPKRQKIYVGCDDNYSRKFDLQQQIGLYDSSIDIKYSLDDLCDQIVHSQNEYLLDIHNPERI